MIEINIKGHNFISTELSANFKRVNGAIVTGGLGVVIATATQIDPMIAGVPAIATIAHMYFARGHLEFDLGSVVIPAFVCGGMTCAIAGGGANEPTDVTSIETSGEFNIVSNDTARDEINLKNAVYHPKENVIVLRHC